MFVPGYRHFLRSAASAQWDETAVDLSADALAWPQLDQDVATRVGRLVAGFCVAEAAVADQIVPFAPAAHQADAAACFEAQAIDEERHARFFDRVATEVMGVPGRTPAARRAALRPALEQSFVELFENRLPSASRALAAAAPGRPDRLASAVTLYHLLLEGIVFSAGQLALARLLDGPAGALTGMREGLGRVLVDERWHIGLGVRLLEEVGEGSAARDALAADTPAAVASWGDAVDQDLAERAVALHRRRLAAAGLGALTAPQPPRRVEAVSSRH